MHAVVVSRKEKRVISKIPPDTEKFGFLGFNLCTLFICQHTKHLVLSYRSFLLFISNYKKYIAADSNGGSNSNDNNDDAYKRCVVLDVGWHVGNFSYWDNRVVLPTRVSVIISL